MEKVINLHIELLPEGVYLGTSKDLPGLIVQGKTIAETIEFAHGVARELIAARQEWERKRNAAQSAPNNSRQSAKPQPKIVHEANPSADFIQAPIDMPVVVAV